MDRNKQDAGIRLYNVNMRQGCCEIADESSLKYYKNYT